MRFHCLCSPPGHPFTELKKKIQLKSKNFLKKKRVATTFFSLFHFSLKSGVTEVTRSARKYCKTGATLGQGGTQAYRTPGRGLNNPLKLL